jgi:hypothetical protein
MKDGVVMYISHFKSIEMLSDEELGQMFRACMRYANGEEYFVPAHLSIAFNFMRLQIDNDTKRYEDKVEKRRLAGRKGGFAKAENQANQSDVANVANAKNAKQNKQKLANLANLANNNNSNNNNNNNSNNNSTSNDVSCNKEIVSVVTTSPSVDALREKSSWIENVAMNYGLTTQGVQSWMDRFESEVINCKLKTHANQKDLASHFCDWLRIKLASQPKGTKEIKFEDINW